jgi:hypothetical protein
MKRFLLAALVAAGVVGVFESSASAFEAIPPGVGARCRRVGRVEGYWLQPQRGPLYDYSSYFAAMYPYLPGAYEYRWQPPGPGPFGTGVAVMPSAPLPPAHPAAHPVTPPPAAAPAPAQPAK